MCSVCANELGQKQSQQAASVNNESFILDVQIDPSITRANKEKLERLRDEFAMHAPHEPQSWFEPVLPKFPAKHPIHPGQGTKAEIAEYDSALEKFSAEARAWDKNGIKQRLIQWPYAWADEVLKAREQSK